MTEEERLPDPYFTTMHDVRQKRTRKKRKKEKKEKIYLKKKKKKKNVTRTYPEIQRSILEHIGLQ